MSEPTSGMRSAAILAVLGIAAGIAYHQVQTTVRDNGTYVEVGWGDAGPDALTQCLETDAKAQPAALSLFGLDAGAPMLGFSRTCADPLSDDTVEPALGSDMLAMPEASYQRQVPYDFDAGWPRFAFWGKDNPSAPFLCACGAGCARPDGWPIAQNITYAPGTWSSAVDGGVCLRKACSVPLGEDDSMPAACL